MQISNSVEIPFMKAGADRVGGREFLVLFLQMHSRTTFYFTNMYFDDLSFMYLL